ncbi:MAG: FadR family transcriptional regulator [Deltaproteobacteria bacterium]|nr:FadR family transcriptional regulator [Deltaproteobacteria bacterium]
MFKKISPKKISDEIIEQFKELLSRGQLKPGDELPSERELAESIGVSRPPLREALNALQAMGFIEIHPRSKIVVKSLAKKPLEDPLTRLISDDIDKFFELLDIRRAMESWAAYTAAKKATNEDINKLEEIIKRDQENLRLNRDDAKTDADLHIAISLAAHNTVLSHLTASCYNILWNSQKMSRKKLFKKKENKRLIAEQHMKIFRAIKAKDPDRASKEARSHIDFVEQEIRKIIDEESLAP